MKTKSLNLTGDCMIEWPLWSPILKAYSNLCDCSTNRFEFSYVVCPIILCNSYRMVARELLSTQINVCCYLVYTKCMPI